MIKLTEEQRSRFQRFSEYVIAKVEVSLENYLALNSFIEKHIEEKQSQIDATYDKIDEIDDVDAWNFELTKFEEENGTELFHFDNEFPNRTRYYMIIQTQAVLEKQLKALCERIRLMHHMPFSIDDLKGNSDIEKGKLYLTRMYGINFRDLEPEWSYVNNMRKLRNQIIHHNGHFTIQDKEILRLIEIIPEVNRMWDTVYEQMEEGQEYEILISSKTLIENYVNAVKVLFRKLIDIIDQKN